MNLIDSLYSGKEREALNSLWEDFLREMFVL